MVINISIISSPYKMVKTIWRPLLDRYGPSAKVGKGGLVDLRHVALHPHVEHGMLVCVFV